VSTVLDVIPVKTWDNFFEAIIIACNRAHTVTVTPLDQSSQSEAAGCNLYLVEQTDSG